MTAACSPHPRDRKGVWRSAQPPVTSEKTSPILPISNTHPSPVFNLHHHGLDVRYRLERVRGAAANRDDGDDFCRISLWCVPPHPLALLPSSASLTRGSKQLYHSLISLPTPPMLQSHVSYSSLENTSERVLSCRQHLSIFSKMPSNLSTATTSKRYPGLEIGPGL